jgi:glutamate N-acetyltransferase/amino-acid N-acetyltransferase
VAVTRPLGFRAAATTAGLKKSGKPDLALIVCDAVDAPVMKGVGHRIDPRHSSAAVFTRNAVVGAPVEIGRAWRSAMLTGEGPSLRAVLVNAGTSNAATGEEGIGDAQECMQAVADALGLRRDEVLPSSTGVIGHRIDVQKVRNALPGLVKALSRGEEADAAAAGAIMTTDLVAKTAHREVEIGGHVVHIGAIAKGSGMIAPFLDFSGLTAGAPAPAHGTMLAFVTTDAAIDGEALQLALESAGRESFDRISVDAHPSCSDTVIVMASGAAPIKTIHASSPAFHGFRAALTAVCQELAEKIIRDGEGATRTFRVHVHGTRTWDEAVRIARAVVDSPLVKCAVHGKDPNWGRIVTAAGNAGIPFDPEETSLSIGGVVVYRNGKPTGSARYDEALKAAMGADRVEMDLRVGNGPGAGWMLGCDLSRDYVRINADYTT